MMNDFDNGVVHKVNKAVARRYFRAGKFLKVRKCLIENERGILYLRPVNNNGELSGRHFSLTPIPGKTYSDYLKPVEE